MIRRPRVVLYNPQVGFYTMPLALLALGSHLPHERYDVVIVDGRLEDDPVAAVLANLDGAICFGVTVLTGAPIRDAIRMSRAVKAARPDLPVVWGGWHPSMFGEECLAELSVDVTVQAQGEATFLDVVERLERGDSLEGCLGCTYRDTDGSVRVNPGRPLADINAFRAHDYALIPVERFYQLKGKPQFDYIGSQGCRFRCAFCADPFVYKRGWVGLAPERVGQEIDSWWRRYHFTDVNFQDETFFTSERRVVAIAEEFIHRRLPISWAATMRADQCVRLSEDVLQTCKRSGLRRLLVGVESGSPDMLKRIAKDITVEQVLETAERCRALGLRVQFPFIVGFPGEDEASVAASIGLAKRLRAMSPDFETHFFYFKPYPGSPITREAVDRGYVLPRALEDWADFDYVGSAGPWVSVEKYRRMERFKFYQRLAWDRVPMWKRPMQALARWRCRFDAYGFPLEKFVSERLRPVATMS